ncbi:hemicentin-1-like [Pelodytes ibericus]
MKEGGDGAPKTSGRGANPAPYSVVTRSCCSWQRSLSEPYLGFPWKRLPCKASGRSYVTSRRLSYKGSHLSIGQRESYRRNYHCAPSSPAARVYRSHYAQDNDCELLPGYSITAPGEVTVQEGLCVHIPCTFTIDPRYTLSANAKGLWFRGPINSGGPIVASKSGSGSNTGGRFILTGDVSKGDCSLSISDVRKSDESRYRFRIEDVVKFNYVDVQPRVTVTDLTDKPVISPASSLVADKEVTLTCMSPGRCAEFNLRFTWDRTRELQNVSIQDYTVDYGDGNRTFHSNITFTPTSDNDNSSLTCTVTNPKSGSSTSADITLNVQYPPFMNITVAGNYTKENASVSLVEGGSSLLSCEIKSKPDSTITWRRGVNMINTTKADQILSYHLTNISVNDAAIYICTAENEHGSISKFFNITVEYPPRSPKISCSPGCFAGDNSTILAKEGSDLSLLCSAESLPPAELSWMKPGGGNTSKSAGEKLNVKLSLNNEGIYTCQARNIRGVSTTNITIRIEPPLPVPQSHISAIIGAAVLIVLLVVTVLVLLNYFRKKKVVEKTEDVQNFYEKGCDDIYCNTTPNIQLDSEKDPADNEPKSEDTSIYMNFEKELQYASLDFSKLTPRIVAEEQEVEYSEIKCAHKPAGDHNDCELVPGYSITAPGEVTVQEGLCVHIPCTFTIDPRNTLSATAKGLWFRGSISSDPPVASKSGSGSNTGGRFILTGDVSKGDCSLSISDVRKSDESRYRFRIEDVVRFNYVDVQPRVTVTDLTDKPVISPASSLVADKEVTLTCMSPGRCADFNLRFTWDRTRELQNEYIQDYTVDYGDGNRTFHSNITFTPTSDNDKSSLTCTVTNPNSGSSTSADITLNVQYPPLMTITVAGNYTKENASVTLVEGGSSLLICEIKSNPDSTITWRRWVNMINTTKADQILSYHLTNISVNDAAIYICTAENEHGSISKFFNITVEYCFVGDNSTILAKDGLDLSLLCSAESLPPADLSWMKPGGGDTSKSTGEKLKMKNVSFYNEGIYTCQARNIHGVSTTNITIRIAYEPKAVKGRNSSCSITENHIECICVVQSFPPAVVSWKINAVGYPAHFTSEKLTIFTQHLQSVTSSNLTLRTLDQKTHTIECKSSNDYGDRVLNLLEAPLTAPQNMPAIIGAVGFIVLLVVTALVLGNYFRKKKVAEKEENVENVYEKAGNDIYCNITPNIQLASEKDPADNEPKSEDTSIYMNFEKELEYASLDFSKLTPRIVAEEQEVEYSEIKCAHKPAGNPN